MAEHKEICLKINGEQVNKLKSGKIKFRNYSKQLAALFKIYADFECHVKRVKDSDKNNNTLYTEKNQDHIPCRFFFYKVVCKNAVHEVIDTMSMIMSVIRAKKL